LNGSYTTKWKKGEKRRKKRGKKGSFLRPPILNGATLSGTLPVRAWKGEGDKKGGGKKGREKGGEKKKEGKT